MLHLEFRHLKNKLREQRMHIHVHVTRHYKWCGLPMPPGPLLPPGPICFPTPAHCGRVQTVLAPVSPSPLACANRPPPQRNISVEGPLVVTWPQNHPRVQQPMSTEAWAALSGFRDEPHRAATACLSLRLRAPWRSSPGPPDPWAGDSPAPGASAGWAAVHSPAPAPAATRQSAPDRPIATALCGHSALRIRAPRARSRTNRGGAARASPRRSASPPPPGGALAGPFWFPGSPKTASWVSPDPTGSPPFSPGLTRSRLRAPVLARCLRVAPGFT